MSNDFRSLATETAADVRNFVGGVRELASGDAADNAIPMMLLMLASLQTTGARLGAVQDIVPSDQFEPDPGVESDLDPLRLSLANLLEGVDDYTDLVDPVLSMEVARGSLSDDLASIVAALEHGLAHFDGGRLIESLWWWQFSYLSEWGARSATALRVIQTLLAHVRLDVDDDMAAEAEFDALHP